MDARAQERSRFEAIVFLGAAESPRTLGAHLRFTLLGPPLQQLGLKLFPGLGWPRGAAARSC